MVFLSSNIPDKLFAYLVLLNGKIVIIDPDDTIVEAVACKGENIIAVGTTKEIKSHLNSDLNVSAIVNLMCDQGLLIRGKPKTGWKSNLHTYYRFDEYFSDLDLGEMAETDAKELMIRQYITSWALSMAKVGMRMLPPELTVSSITSLRRPSARPKSS